MPCTAEYNSILISYFVFSAGPICMEIYMKVMFCISVLHYKTYDLFFVKQGVILLTTS